MLRRLPLLFPVALSGCIAAAADGVHDVVTLKDGTRLVGEVIDVEDGKYWVLQMDGHVVAADFRDVSRVEMAGERPEPVASEDLPLPEWREGRDEGPIGGGFDFGLMMGARLRFRLESKAVDHVDLRLGTTLLFASSLGFATFVGGEVALFGNSPVHLGLSLNAGPAVVSGLYPFVGAGASLQIDPKGPFEAHIGAIGGTTVYYWVVAPELSASWVW